jgi:dCMP deaminase
MIKTEELIKYLLLTDKVAEASKDLSTKVGAIFLNKKGTAPRSFGYNGMPRGLDDNHPERNERPEKYLWFEHAERNGIYNLAQEILQDKIMVSTSHPTMESARAIVSCGIKRIIIKYSELQEKSLSDEDKKMNERVKQLFIETGVEFIKIDMDIVKAGFSPYDIKINFGNNPEKDFALAEKYSRQIELLQQYANDFSPDRDSKNGCMILNEKTFAPIENGFGVNAPPTKFKEITEEMHQDKSQWFQEAEKNAIFNAVAEKLSGTTAIASWCPCNQCTLAMASVEIGTIVTRQPDFTQEADLRWKESFERSQRICELADINFIALDVPKPQPEVKSAKKAKMK